MSPAAHVSQLREPGRFVTLDVGPESLLVVAQPDGSVQIPLRITQSDLAALVGATRVRVNEVLAGFTRRKMIAIDRQLRISVLDRDELEAYLL